MIYRKRDMAYLVYEASKVTTILEIDKDPAKAIKKLPKLENDLLFDCSFECGNLDQVRQRQETEYDIWMRNDTNGAGNL